MTTGRVLRISAPSLGSSRTSQTSNLFIGRCAWPLLPCLVPFVRHLVPFLKLGSQVITPLAHCRAASAQPSRVRRGRGVTIRLLSWTVGEGVMSLRRAFRIAGAQTDLASHWKVSDKATTRLMTEFIGRWRAGEPRAKAWREAQLSLLHSKDFSNPYFWAAFTLTGQWK